MAEPSPDKYCIIGAGPSGLATAKTFLERGIPFDCLEREVGLAQCVVVLTADHGVGPLPERVQALRPAIPAGRVKTADLDAAVKSALDAQFGALPENEVWFVRDNSGYHLKPTALAAKKLAADVKVCRGRSHWTPGQTWLSTSDTEFATWQIGRYIRAAFPEPGPYETVPR